MLRQSERKKVVGEKIMVERSEQRGSWKVKGKENISGKRGRIKEGWT